MIGERKRDHSLIEVELVALRRVGPRSAGRPEPRLIGAETSQRDVSHLR
jgi:hypothetical protein